MHGDTWNIIENISSSAIANAPSSLDHFNTFLESREVSPIRYTLRTSWNETSDNLESVAEHLGEMDMGMSWAKEMKGQLKKCKRYLKSDYKVCILRFPGLYFFE